MLWRCALALAAFLPAIAQLPTLDFARLKPDAIVAVGLRSGAVATPDGLWVPQDSKPSIVRVDAKNNSPGAPIALARPPCASLTEAFDTVWVPTCGGEGAAGAVARVHSTHGNVSASIPLTVAEPKGTIASASGSVWLVTDAKGVLSRIDPATNEAVAEVFVAAKPFAVVADQDQLWVTSEEADTLTRIDAATNLIVETIKVGPRPGSLAVGDAAVWTLNRGDGSVSRVDVKTNKVTSTIKVDESVATGTLATGEGAVWISAPGVPLVRIDPRTNRVTHKFIGSGGGVVIVAHGSVWVGVDAKTTWRVDPKLIAAMRPD
jgi:YVTN family beta-propeller protein